MASGDIFRISSGQPGQLLDLSLTYDYHEYSDEPILFTFSMSGSTATGDRFDTRAIAEADTIRNGVVLRLNGLTPVANCLLACGGANILKPLIACMNIDRAVYIDCLKAKGVDIAYDTATCCLICLQTGP